MICLVFIICFFFAFVLVISLATTARKKADRVNIMWCLAMSVQNQLRPGQELLTIVPLLSYAMGMKTKNLSNRLLSGATLSQALQQHRDVLPEQTRLAITLAEENGTLPKTLRDEAVRVSQPVSVASMQQFSITSMAMYCLAVPTVMISILGFIMYYIIPKFKNIFEDFGIKLPEITVQLIEISDLLVNYFYLISPAFCLIVYFICQFYVKSNDDWERLKLPILGIWFKRWSVPNMLRLLRQSIDADKSVLQPIALIAEEHNQPVIRSRARYCNQEIASGKPHWSAMQQAGLLTHHEVALLDSAERAGNLSWALNELANTLARRQIYRWLVALELFQPLIVILIGLVVAACAVGLFYPLVEMTLELSPADLLL